MASASPKPLTLQEAKEQLRTAGQRPSPTGWLQRHPLQFLALSLSCGFLAGNRRQSGVEASLMLQKLVPVIVSTLLFSRKTT